MEELLENLHPVAALGLGLILLLWVALMLMVPFMIEGIRNWTRKTHQELEQVNRNLERLTVLLSRQPGEPLPARPEALPQKAAEAVPAKQSPAPAKHPAAPARDARKEPIISDHPIHPDDDRGPRISGGLHRRK